MIQLSTLPQTGMIPGIRVAGFPLGTTSDFAIAFADLAGAAGVVVTPPAPPGEVLIASMAGASLRQPLANGGKDLPTLTDIAPGIAEVFPKMTGYAVVAEPPANAAPEPAFAAFAVEPPVASPITAERTILTVRPTTLPTPDQANAKRVGVSSTPPTQLKGDAVPPAAKPVSNPSEVERMPADATLDDVPARPRRSQVAAAPDLLLATEIFVPATPGFTERATDLPISAAAPSEVKLGEMVVAPPMSIPVSPPAVQVAAPPTPVAQPTRFEAAAPQGPALAPDVTVTATPRRPTLAPGVTTIAAPQDAVPVEPPQRGAAPVVDGETPVSNPPTTSKRAIPARGTAQSNAIPVPVGSPIPLAATPVPVAPQPTLVTASVLTPRGQTIAASAKPGREARPPVASAPVPAAPTPTSVVEAIAACAMSPGVPTQETAIEIAPAIQPSLAPVVATPRDAGAAPVASLPTTLTVTSFIPVAVSPVAPVATGGVALLQPELKPAAAVTVTVVALPAAAPPTPQLQPAAQAFAAAMFAARAPVEAMPVERSEDLSFAAVSAAPAPFSAAMSVVAPTPQGQQPTLDLTKSDWMASMIDRIETLRDESGGVRETRMKLAPEALGGVEVSVRRDESGAIQVRIAAETPQARALLAEAAPKLAEMAEARGVKLGGSSVDAGTSFADQGRRDAQGSASAQRRPPSATADDTTDTITDTRLA